MFLNPEAELTLAGVNPARAALRDLVGSLGTVSKSLAPTLRLGWILAPDRLLGALARGKRLADRGSPGLDRLALATLIEAGRCDRHLRRARAGYATRREALIAP
jgi:GntR family transcriptional regulator/MocR family aminotransferase